MSEFLHEVIKKREIVNRYYVPPTPNLDNILDQMVEQRLQWLREEGILDADVPVPVYEL